MGSTVDALHAELLGDLAEIHKLVVDLKTTLPKLHADAKQDTEETAENLGRAFAEFKESSIAMVGYIKARQQETLGALNSAQEVVMTATQKTLGGFEKYLWIIGGLAVSNTLLLTILTVLVILKRG